MQPIDSSKSPILCYLILCYSLRVFNIRKEPFSMEWTRSEEHTSELQSRLHLVCRLLLEKKKTTNDAIRSSVDTSAIIPLPALMFSSLCQLSILTAEMYLTQTRACTLL